MLGKCAVAFRTGLVRKGGMAWGKDACTHKEEWTPIIGMGESGSQTCFDTSKRQGAHSRPVPACPGFSLRAPTQLPPEV